MDTFLLITSFLLIATASADSGYNYQQQNSRPFPSAGNNGIYSGQQSLPLPSFNSQSGQQYSQPSSQYLSPVQQTSSYAQHGGAGQQSAPYPAAQQQTIISKDIYIHSAPEETEEIRNVLGGGDPAPIRKNYRIVFIKAPSHNIRFNTQYIKQAQVSNEEKTVIYVLAKKPEIANIQNEVAAPQVEQKNNKPEVYFIRYKTQDEANRAQQEIQAQYESLGGTTQISDEGVAPVTSVIGGGTVNGGSGGGDFSQSATSGHLQISGSGIRNQQSFQGGQTGGFGFDAPNKKYLPAKRI